MSIETPTPRRRLFPFLLLLLLQAGWGTAQVFNPKSENDLEIISVTLASTTVDAGNPLSVTVTFRNNGEGDITAPFYCHLSVQGMFGTTVLVQETIAAGAEFSLGPVAVKTLPEAPRGTYELVAFASFADPIEANNYGRAFFDLASSYYVDLQLSAISPSQSYAPAGGVIDFSVEWSYNGNVPQRAIFIDICLSEDTVMDDNDRYVAHSSGHGDTIPLHIPSDLAPGPYFLVGCIYSPAVPDDDASDNCASVPFTVMSSENVPNLKIQSPGNVGDLAYIGETITAAIHFYPSPAPVDSFDVSMALRQGEQIHDLGIYSLSGMDADVSWVSPPIQIPISETLAPGTYELYVCADPANSLIELDETDNCGVISTFRVEGIPDLEISSLSLSASGPAEITWSARIRNNGHDLNREVLVTSHWSRDPVIGREDRIMQTIPIYGLESLQERTTPNESVVVPSFPGTHYFGVCVDLMDSVRESDESNNCVSVPVTVTADIPPAKLPPDLEILGVTTDVDWAAPGETVNLYFNVTNSGGAATHPITVKVLLKPRGAAKSEEPIAQSGAQTIDPLPADSSYFFGPIPLRIPDGLTREDLVLQAWAQTDFNAGILKFVEIATFDLPFYIGAEAPPRDLSLDNPYTPGYIPSKRAYGTVSFFRKPTYQSPAPLLTSTRTRITWSPYPDPAPGDRLLASFYTGAIDPRDDISRGGAITVGLPENAPKMNYITVCVDTDDLVAETDESNNCKTFECRAEPLGDFLRVADLELDSPAAGIGEYVTASFAIQNGGEGSKHWPHAKTARALLSVHPIRKDYQQLSFIPVPSIDPGGKREYTLQLQIPPGLSAGTHYILVCLDPSDFRDKRNECAVAPIQVLSPRSHDLRAYGLSVTPSQGFAGDTVRVEFSAINDGNAGTDSFLNTIRWSRDALITPEDPPIRHFGWGRLDPGQNIHVRSSAVTIPRNAPPGVHYIAVCVDSYADPSLNGVVETREDNNCSLVPFTVQSAGSPVTATAEVQEVTPELLRALPGESLGLNWRVRNTGSADSGPVLMQFGIDYAFSEDDNGFLPLGSLETAGIAPGTSRAFGPVSIQIPGSAPSGPAYIVVRTSLSSGYSDQAFAGFLVGPAETHELTADIHAPSTITRGVPLSLAVVTSSGGDALLTTPTRTTLFWSPDPEFASYQYVMADLHIPFLGPFASHADYFQVPLPGDVPTGTVYLTACADTTDAVREADEGNNCKTVPLTVNPPGFLPNHFSIAGAASGPGPVAPGEIFTVTYSAVPDGPAYVSGSETPVTAYFLWSPDPVLDGGDAVIHEAELGSLSAASNYHFSTRLRVPSGIAAGSYYVGICTRPGPSSLDWEGMHSCSLVPVSVQSSKTHDLKTSDLFTSAPAGRPGEAVYLSFALSNNGNAATPEFTNSIRLSADRIVDGNDPELRSLPCGGLDAGESLEVGPIAVSLPADLKAGTYYLAACADLSPDGTVRVPESDRGNNCTLVPFTISGERGGSETPGKLRW